MNVIFRVDASIKMGIGHVMRCLTLADVLRVQGKQVSFICRAHQGHLIQLIEQKGYVVFSLGKVLSEWQKEGSYLESPSLVHASWLGASQIEDARQCQRFVEQLKPDWLIVDHYALDYRWQQTLQPYYKQLIVIDDLADRQHHCAVLLDQNYGRKAGDYQPFVSKNCKLLLGTGYALLRSEFAQLRCSSLARRTYPEFKKLLITMGGVDVDNVTSQVLEILQQCSLSAELSITVVMGATAPHLETVKQLAANMPNAIQVKCNVQNMAELMVDSDIAIGAAGATTWERCCLGLPTIVIVLAENQRMIAEQLEVENMAWLVKRDNLNLELKFLIESFTPESLQNVSNQCMSIIDGLGANKVAKVLIEMLPNN